MEQWLCQGWRGMLVLPLLLLPLLLLLLLPPLLRKPPRLAGLDHRLQQHCPAVRLTLQNFPEPWRLRAE